ncbi:BMP family ABC transporter substrate-binding protein [Paenibacillus xylaniclasticus]|uniref:BMP family ABC transporter substrate-binding protein n=1 Tax=Paenibacillus xylaniclasticus TaxID=588083 RepID=UPI000FDCBC50|nr:MULTISPECIES: BMP family ABC transporter substrate-binding protein [Paenibacillus]GFN33669.1 BMP family ABC transporter substrate-binding protein [Paenibacillus curdlanolyticus]
MKKWMLLLIMVILAFTAACSKESSKKETPSDASGTTAEEPAQTSTEAVGKKPRVAFVYIGVPGDGGWTYQHDLGRQAVDEKFGIKSTTVENVPEGPDAQRIFEELAQKNDIVFGTSFGYMDAMVNAAAKYPNVKFAHATGYKTADNLSTYAGRGYQTGFLSGMAAGKITKNNKIGYAAAFPIPEVIYTINAFTLGAQSVNPDATVQVVWTNTWFDPAVERQAAISLLDQGVDVLANYQDSPAGIQAAAERNVYGLGNDSDMNKYAPDYYLTNPTWNWAPYYIDQVQQVVDGTWQSSSYWGSIADGVADIAPFGISVPQDVRDLIEAKKKEIIDGTYQVFSGPIIDQDGNEKAAAGTVLTDEDIHNMMWFVQGVSGTIPKS